MPDFGADVPVIGSGLGQLFNFGSTFSNAASAGRRRHFAQPGADGVAGPARPDRHLLDQHHQPRTGHAGHRHQHVHQHTAAFSIDQVANGVSQNVQAGGVDFVLNGTINVSGTATANLQLALSFDTSQPDASRVELVEGGASTLALAFTAATSTPITAMAALGLTRVSVNNGSLTIGSAGDPTKPATATLTFGVSSYLTAAPNNRVSQPQLLSNAAGTIADSAPIPGPSPPPLPPPGWAASPSPGRSWRTCPWPAPTGRFQRRLVSTGTSPEARQRSPAGTQVSALLAASSASSLAAFSLDAPTVAGLQLAGQWGSAVATAAGPDQRPVDRPAIVRRVAEPAHATAGRPIRDRRRMQAFAVAGTSTASFAAAINTALATFNAANPATP